jgi:AAA family ATP:ADP antiporter
MQLSSVWKQLLDALGIHPAEKKIFLLTLGLAFIIGSMQCYLIAIPYAVFLTKYKAQQLPWVYLYVAGTGLLFGLIYNRFEPHFSIKNLLIAVTLLLALTAILFWFLLISSTKTEIIFALLVWSIVANSLADFGIWGALNQIYTLQQGKKLFGLVGASQSIGAIASGLFLPLLIKILNINHIILIIGILTGISAYLLAKILKTNVESGTKPSVKKLKSKSKGIHFQNIKNPFILKVFAMIMLSVFAQYVVDILFNYSAEQRFHTKESLAEFFGAFIGFTNAFDLIFSLFFYAWFMKRFGLIRSLYIRPFAATIIAIIALFINQIPPLMVIIFWFISLLKLFEESLRPTVSDIGSLILLQPFPPRQRSQALLTIDMFITPIATGIISIALIFFEVNITKYLITAILCYATYMWILIPLKKGYIAQISLAIAKHYLSIPIYQAATLEHLGIFRRYLNSKYPDEIAYSLSLIEQIDKNEFIKSLDIALQSKHPLVQEYSLKKIEDMKLNGFDDKLFSLLKNEKNDEIRARILLAIANINYSNYQEVIENYTRDKSILLQCTALQIILTYSSETKRKIARKQLSKILKSEDKNARRYAIFVLGEINQHETNVWLKNYIDDPFPIVRQETYKAIINTHHTELFNHVLMNFSHFNLDSKLICKFSESIDSILKILKTNLPGYDSLTQRKILSLLGCINKPAVKEYLEEIIFEKQRDLSLCALKSLVRISIKKNQHLSEKVEMLLRQEIGRISEKNRLLEMIPAKEQTQSLEGIFRRQIALSMERLMLFLTLIYNKNSMLKIKYILETGSEREISYAIELLESKLTNSHKKLILPILSQIYFSDSEKYSKPNLNDLQRVLKKGLYYDVNDDLSLILCITCIYVIKKLKLSALFPAVQDLVSTKQPVILETINWLNKS